jgi:transposase-like protein
MTSLQQIHKNFDTQDKCMTLLVSLRWPDGVRCPRCGNDKVFKIKHRAWNWVCKSGAETVDKQTGEVHVCKKQGYRFSPLVGTVFENTNYPLPVWFEVIYLICQSKKGMSALQIQRMLTETGRPTAYKTAFYICHRVRAMLENDQFGQLMGQVEIDETYLSGKDKNRHANKRHRIRGTGDKIPVIGAISRKGNVVCQMIERADMPTMHRFVNKVVDKDKVELVATDEHSGYQYLERWQGLPHQTVNHRKGEYVRGIVHTNNMENFWSLLKRGIVGTYHNVSKKYLPLYLNEFQWRFNHRKDPDIFLSALSGC